jgi:serine/threonine protein kinase
MMGRTIAHYEILETLGQGGMGFVYKARDTQLDRLVAIKVLTPDKLTNDERKSRFIQEAKAASALNHPNIVTIHAIGSEDGVDFIAMEYIAGRTLDRVIPKNGLKLAELLTYGVQIADALASAHAAGIVHRDLKPGTS